MTRIRKLSQFTKNEVDQLFDQAKLIVKEHGLTILRAPQQKDFGRILIVTSRKVGNAPTRNKIRRRLKSIFFENKLFENGFDYAVVVNKKATELAFDELKELLLKATK